jgi:hypothetical protein
LYEVERVQREYPRKIGQDARLEGPARRGTGESAGTDCVGERPVQWGALLDRVFATGIFDSIGEVKVKLLTELVHSAKDARGRLGLLGDRETDRGEVGLVKDGGAMGPRQEVERHREVLSPLAGVVTPGHGVDEIKRGVAADQRDRVRP